MPSDRGNGLAMRTGFLLDAYAKRFEIDLAIIPVAGGATELTPFVKARISRAGVLRAAPPDTHFALISGIADREARLAAFRQYGRPSIAAGLSDALERALLAFAGERSYQLVHVSRLYLASLAANWREAKAQRPCLVLDCDEDDMSAYRRVARLERRAGGSRRADWAEAEADAFRVMARQWLPRFDVVLAASPGEASLLGTHQDGLLVNVVPNVAPRLAVRPARRFMGGGRRDILFVGNLGYLPNIDAVTWFASRIWPRLRGAVPLPIRLVIAGPGAPRQVTALGRRPGIVIAGPVDDVGRLYRRAALAVVPIRAGGGTRIKLLESASYGVPIVATRFGAAGTGLRSSHELLLADTEQDFAACCERLLTDDRLASSLAVQARRTAGREYDPRRWAARLLALIDARCGSGERHNDGSFGEG
jgi:glycosyltransferase involved in cell wall biosynthesis